MKKALPILGATGAALAGFGIGLASGLAIELLLVLVVLAGAVFCFLERGGLAIGLGLALVAGAILAALAAVAPVTTEDGEYLTGLADPGPAVVLLAGMALAGAVVALRWRDLEPRWFGITGAVLVGLGAVSLFLIPQQHVGNPTSVAAASMVVCLAAMAPGVVAARRA